MKLAGALVVAWSSLARAGGHPLVQLEVDDCIDAPRDDIRRVAAIELGGLLGDASDAGPERTRAAVTCDGALVVLRVDDPITGKSLARTIDLSAAMPKARARLVALAVAELISASWTELEANPVPAVPPSGPRASLAAREVARTAVRAKLDLDEPSRFELRALGGGVKFLSGTAMLAGGGIRVTRDRSTIGWMIDARVDHGSSRVSLGNVSTNVLAVGAAAVVHRSWAPWTARLGGGLRGGAAQLTGEPDPTMQVRAQRFWAPWLGPFALGDVALAIGPRLALDLGVEGGLVISPVGAVVAGRREVAVDGAWIGVHLGVGMFL